MTGTITFNDELPVNEETFNLYGSYVEKEDLLFSYFTVREAIRFAARLKLKVDIATQDRLVEQTIYELNLAMISDMQIGSYKRQFLSGGERKRVAIACELVSDPSIIVLDEPTSGLDSFNASKVCGILKKLAHEKGKTVLATIHNPNSEVFFFFDRIILMMDGNIMYQGDVKNSIHHFSMCGRPVPRFINPADYYMRVL